MTPEGPAGEPLRNDMIGLLVDAVRDYAIFLLSPSGEIRTWNSGAERTMGYGEAEIVGRVTGVVTRLNEPENVARREFREERADSSRKDP